MQLQLHGGAKRTGVLVEFHSKLNLFVSAKHNINFLRWNPQQISVIFSFLYVVDLTFSIHCRTELEVKLSLTEDAVFLIRLWPVGM